MKNAVDEGQMNRLMQEGGIADDGMEVEPVTGNEIPPGSLAEEVRDDIDAKLSSGEYVVPADVVRFFGVKFFEDLRMQAKEGLMEMEGDGRIGGTPVDDSGVPLDVEDEELTPEEEQMLLEALGATDGMAMGGMVEPQYMSNPYQDQTALYQKPYGMAEGGIVPPTPPAVPSPFETSGFDRTTFELPTTSSGIETRKYYNPTTKETRNISFMNGTPLGAIPVGFVPWTQELQDQTEQPPVTPTTPVEVQATQVRGGGAEERRQEGDTGRTGETTSWADRNREGLDSDPLSVGLDALERAGLPGGKLGVGLASAVNPALGLGVKVVSDAMKIDALGKANAAKKVAQERGLPTSTLDAKIQEMEDSLSGVAKTAYSNGLIGTGNTYYRGYKKTPATDTGTPVPTKTKTGTGGTSTGGTTGGGGGAQERRGGTTKTGGGTNKPANKTSSKTTATPSGTKTASSTAGYKEGAKEKPLPTPKTGQSYTEALREEKAKKDASKTKSGTKTSSGTKSKTSTKGGSVGARAKGGLVTRPEKKEYDKSRKGLAS